MRYNGDTSTKQIDRSGALTPCGLSKVYEGDYAVDQYITILRMRARWSTMIARCVNPNSTSYKRYGARGITVCDEWRNSFDAFYEHVRNLPDYGKKGHTLDRVDNSGNYEPGNVRWADRATQTRNSRRARMITYNGKTQCLCDWAQEVEVTETTIRDRLNKGWSVERALFTPRQWQWNGDE